MVRTPAFGVSAFKGPKCWIEGASQQDCQSYLLSACRANVMQNHLVVVELLPHPLRKNRRRSSHHCMRCIHGRVWPHERLRLRITRRGTVHHCVSRIYDGAPAHDRSWLCIHSRWSGHHCVGWDHGVTAGIDRSRKPWDPGVHRLMMLIRQRLVIERVDAGSGDWCLRDLRKERNSRVSGEAFCVLREDRWESLDRAASHLVWKIDRVDRVVEVVWLPPGHVSYWKHKRLS